MSIGWGGGVLSVGRECGMGLTLAVGVEGEVVAVEALERHLYVVVQTGGRQMRDPMPYKSIDTHTHAHMPMHAHLFLHMHTNIDRLL